MPRQLTGCVVWSPHADGRTGHWKARITLPDGRRPWFHFDQRFTDPSDQGKARAKEAALGRTELYNSSNVVPLGPVAVGETVSAYAQRWLASREGKIATVYDNERNLNKYILPDIGPLEMAKVTSKDLEAIVEKLDRLADDDLIAPRTAINIWSVCSQLFDDAAHSKQKDLRCLDVDPCEHVRGPDNGDRKMLQFLYPSEFLAFWSCDDIPFAFRCEVAFAIYLCLRDGEQRALRWEDIDLEHGVVRVARKFDRHSWSEQDGTKKSSGRIIPIPDAIMPLLQHMAAQAATDGEVWVFGDPKESVSGTKAEILREYLQMADVTRNELHVSTKTSRQIRWHDLRATGGTWYAVEGRSATEIRDVLGHTQTSMTDRYMRAAGMLRGGRFGKPFPKLAGGKVLGKVLVLTKSPTSLYSSRDTRADKVFANNDSGRNQQVGSEDSRSATSSNVSTRRAADDSLDVSGSLGAQSSGLLSSLHQALEVAVKAGDMAAVTSVAKAISALQVTA